MLITAVVFRGTLGAKSAISQASVFKNLLQKSIFRRHTGFHVWKGNFRTICSSSRRHISVSRFSKTGGKSEFYDKATTVLNNVIIFKYDKPRIFAFMITFAVVQLIGMLSMAQNIYRTFCQDFFNPGMTWRQRFHKHPFSIFAIFCGCFFGPVIFISIMFFSCRQIRRIILHKGGQKVTIVTYHPIPRMAAQTLPLDSISCVHGRANGNTVAIKILDRRFYFFLDGDGEYPNSDLFDYTVGVRRT